MAPPTCVRRAALHAVALAITMAACGDDETHNADDRNVAITDTEPAEPHASASPAIVSDDATAALAICSALRDQANLMTHVANAAAADIHAKTPAERYGAILSGFDAATDGVTGFADSITAVDMPLIPEREQLLGDIAAGADAALAELADERARFVEAVGGTVADDDVQGRVGQFFNSVEKVNSLVEPTIAHYERVELQRAFLDQPECRHVVQPFVIDQ